MKPLQIRNVPDDVHRTLKSRAAAAGMSLSGSALGELRRAAERPTREEILARIAHRPPHPSPGVAGRCSAGRARCQLIVLDASAVVALLLHTDGGEQVAGRIAQRFESLHAPHLLAVEVAQVLRRFATAGSIEVDVAASALEDLATLDITRYAHEPLLGRVWKFA